MEEFLESCRATSLLAELEDDEELPEADEEDEDENEEDCEDNYDEETSESSRSLLRFHFCFICVSGWAFNRNYA
jgi:E3 ubiquitin-protein ligase HECTD1